MKLLNIFIFSALLLLTIAFINGYGVRYNASPSLSQKVYFSSPASEISRGKIVTFCHPNSKATFAKIIAGLPGDRIEIEDGIILIDGIPQGKQSPNSMLSYTPSGIIPEGFFFAIGCCSDSFDSRYALFGLVPITAIKEQLWPIF